MNPWSASAVNPHERQREGSVEGLKRDVLVGLRLLRRDKAYSVTVAITLALCLGANVALFSVVHHVLLRPLPVQDPGRLVMMANTYPNAGAGDSTNSGVPDYYDRLRDVTALSDQALFNSSNVSLGQAGVPTRVRVINVTPSYFAVLGTKPALGRPFTEQEGEPGSEKKVVLADSFWRSQWGADAAVVGRTLQLDGEPYEIVGVMPRGFEAIEPNAVLWRPLAFTPEAKSDDNRHSNNYWHIGRLKPGASLEQVQSQVDALNAANDERFPQFREILKNAGFRTVAQSYPDRLVKAVKPTLQLLWGGAVFVLLIGCVNVANLVLVRARARLKDMGTRLALGASPLLVARQLVVENLLLSGAAAVMGLGLASLALRSAALFALESLPHASDIALDGAAVAFAAALSFVIGLGMGLLPVATVLPASLTRLLREEGRSSTGGRGARALRRGMVVAQVAFTFVLLFGAGLLLASFRKVQHIDPGFRSDGVLTGTVVLPRARYADEAAWNRFTDQALREVRALPGVSAAGATDTIPFGGRNNDSVILAEGYQMAPGESLVSPRRVDVSPGYFEAMGATLVKGRYFTDADIQGAQPVLMVDERLAQKFWPGQDPIGRRMYQPQDPNDFMAVTDKTVFLTVVGVIRNMTLADLTEGKQAVGAYYYPVGQDASRILTFALKTTGKPESLTGGFRGAIARLDPELPLFEVKTLEQRMDEALLGRRSPAFLSMSFGLVALMLSAVGTYGVLAYLVTQRTREFGIRMALGGTTRSIFDLVMREGVLLLGLGTAVGIVGALVLRGSLESQLYGIGALDPGVVGATAGLMAAVALIACTLPALRATRIDPKVALRD
jgi:predicted permease